MRPSSLSRSRTSSRVASGDGRISSEGSRESSGRGSPSSRTLVRRAWRVRRKPGPSPFSISANSSSSSLSRSARWLSASLTCPSPMIRTIMSPSSAWALLLVEARGVLRLLLGLRLAGAALDGLLRRRTSRQLRLHALQFQLYIRTTGDLVQLGLDVVLVHAGLVVQDAGGEQFVDRAGPRLELCRLVLGTLNRQADVAHLLGDAGERLADTGLGLGRGVRRLDGLLLRAEGVHLGLEALGRKGELLLLALQRRVLCLEVRHLLLQRGTAGQRLAGEVLPAERERLAALVLQLARLRLQLVELEFQALAGGGDIGHAPAHLLEQLQLLLIRVIEGFARVLGPVKGLVRLRAEDHPHTLHDTAHGLRAPPSDGLPAPALRQNPQYGPCIH